MILTIYIIILAYFVLGAIGFYFINRKKSREDARKNRIKLITYFLIIHILFVGIVFNPVVFHYLAILIIIAGYYEIIGLFIRSTQKSWLFFILSLLIYSLLSLGLYNFSLLNKDLILFTFIVLSVFDSFSQISGQIMGKRKLMPDISPNKTIEGLLGGAIIALITAFLVRSLISYDLLYLLLVVAGILVFAFLGDMLTSYYKRRYQTKDFSKIIPGHGGFLDRFDSLIAGGAWISIISLLI